jgi:putative transposase
LGSRAQLSLRPRTANERVIERFFRTFKKQVVHGRIYQTINDVRDAVRTFVARYNADWLIEKNGHASPSHARATWNHAMLSVAA